MLKPSQRAAHTLCFQVSCKGAESAPLLPVPSLVTPESPDLLPSGLRPSAGTARLLGVSDLSKPRVGQVLSYKAQVHLSGTCSQHAPLDRAHSCTHRSRTP